jgi:ZIP family zinc transporter
MALGGAWASESAGLGLFVFVAIALQNVPEGTATAIPLREANVGLGKAFWAAVATSAPQPVGAVAAFLLVDAAHSLLGAALGFAAGAMLTLVAVDIAPTAFAGEKAARGIGGALCGGAIMFALGALLNID